MASVLGRLAVLLGYKNLRGLDLSGLDLRKANLEMCDLTGARLDRCNLRGARATGANFTGASMLGADCRAASFVGADFERATIINANLAGADFSTADLRRINLAGQDLQAVNFTGANLTDATLEEANLRDAVCTGVIAWNVNLKSADARGANFRSAILDGAQCDNADLSRVDLTGAAMIEASLSDTKLWDAELSGCKLGGATLSGVRIDLTQLNKRQQARFEEATRRDAAQAARSAQASAGRNQAPFTTGDLYRQALREAEMGAHAAASPPPPRRESKSDSALEQLLREIAEAWMTAREEERSRTARRDRSHEASQESAPKHAPAAPDPTRNQNLDGQRVYLDVPFEEKAEAKALGAVWDPTAAQWFVVNKHYTEAIERWQPRVHDGNAEFAQVRDEEVLEVEQSGVRARSAHGSGAGQDDPLRAAVAFAQAHRDQRPRRQARYGKTDHDVAHPPLPAHSEPLASGRGARR